jgi:uncharacterized protein with von Willebrand factor type A (vWA) domain
MFVPFFFSLRNHGVPVTPTAFLRLQKALGLGMINSLSDLYTVARAVLVKSERDFDTYDQVFAEMFAGMEFEDLEGATIEAAARSLLDEWLRDREDLARTLGLSAEQLRRMSADELLQYFLDRLKDQDEAHHGGSRWIGTKGKSPVGHSGNRPGGMRVGGASRSRSATKVALERRYRDYARSAPLTRSQMGEALKRLRHLLPTGPRDMVNIDRTIYQTMRNAGEIEIVFDRRLTDRLKVVLLIDNGGWSMDPYVATVQALFHHARSQFKELNIFYFHNTVNERVWHDAARSSQPEPVESLIRRDPETRLIVVGDASMAPEELLEINGNIAVEYRQKQPSIERLKLLARTFRHAVWLNPMCPSLWAYGETISIIRRIIPMFPLTLDGLEEAVRHLNKR